MIGTSLTGATLRPRLVLLAWVAVHASTTLPRHGCRSLPDSACRSAVDRVSEREVTAVIGIRG